MRIYYFIHRPSDYDVLRNTGDKLEKQFKKFNNKHSSNGFQYYTMLGLGHGVYINGIFAYQENDKVYEFFTGCELGDVEYNTSDPSIATSVRLVGQIFPPINLLVEERSNAYYYGTRLTPSQFAYDVEPHMREKKQIIRIMQEYFELCHQAWLIRNRNLTQDEMRKHSRDTYSTNQLESFLDKR